MSPLACSLYLGDLPVALLLALILKFLKAGRVTCLRLQTARTVPPAHLVPSPGGRQAQPDPWAKGPGRTGIGSAPTAPPGWQRMAERHWTSLSTSTDSRCLLSGPSSQTLPWWFPLLLPSPPFLSFQSLNLLHFIIKRKTSLRHTCREQECASLGASQARLQMVSRGTGAPPVRPAAGPV